MKKTIFTALMVLMLLAPLVFSGCTSAAGEGFAIYLTKDNTPVATMLALSHYELAAEPLITMDDIVAYHWDSHVIELTPEAYDRIDNLEVPTTGKSFVVCVDKAPVYWGAFWAAYSSQSFDGVTINVKPIFSVGNKACAIQIGRGYPASSFSQGDDPRPNPMVKDALEKAGKLK